MKVKRKPKTMEEIEEKTNNRKSRKANLGWIEEKKSISIGPAEHPKIQFWIKLMQKGELLCFAHLFMSPYGVRYEAVGTFIPKLFGVRPPSYVCITLSFIFSLLF
ncbi:hypothetical protein AVEN_23214-1 [Araneus ventricosus]|uniref:Uncharacterized protein n=1 Tax=Araneus ventricosus TaxID=182803 RepID=A0A4Y2JZS3_ARAVE|nr:hypothetical protein AVEN_23214-1 [Araneus ventricosus]